MSFLFSINFWLPQQLPHGTDSCIGFQISHHNRMLYSLSIHIYCEHYNDIIFYINDSSIYFNTNEENEIGLFPK